MISKEGFSTYGIDFSKEAIKLSIKLFKKEKLNKYLTNFVITDNVYESNIKQDRKIYFHKLGYASGFDFLRKLECDKSSPTKKNIKVINNASNKMSRKKNDF